MSHSRPPTHIGRNISRIRELRGLKQDALAFAIGLSQQTISHIENSETVDDEKIKLIAKELGVSVDAIKNFSEEAVFNYFNDFHDNDFSNNNGPFINGHGHMPCNFNALDKLMESHEENKKLYERLVESEKHKVAYLEKLLK